MFGRKPIILLTVLVLTFILAACGSPAATTPPAAAKPTQEWKSDGAVSQGEYAQTHKIGEIEVFTRVEGDSAMMALRAQAKGWVALGIDPEEKMRGADMIFGYVKDGQVVVVDMYSTGTFGPHPADVTQGGTNDVTMVSGSFRDGILTVEFKRKLNTGDSKDKELKIGDNKVIWAVGDVPDPAAKHGRRGAGTLTLQR